jgi:Xaa-Pro dipeptidase
VSDASDAMIAAIRDGVSAADVHNVARQVIADAGLDDYRVHLSGYGIGPGFPPSWAEPLYLLEDSRHVLRTNMVVTIEPPVFIGPERIGVRIIDNVLVTERGAELLARDPRDLVVVG